MREKEKEMKKRFIAALLLVVMCMGAFSACSLTGKLEKDVQVYLETSDGLLGPYTVNAFNNAIVPAQEAPRGKKQLGWTDDKNWNEKDIKNVSVSENVGLIRYDDVKNYAKKGKVTLYPVFGDITRHDIAIAWYDKEKTSGLNQSVMDDFTDALKAYLTEQGMNPAEMDIVVRGYDGNVGTSCGNIMKDSDIDIMIGWAAKSNLEGTGGLKAGEDFLQNYGNITLKGAVNNKARYAARLGDTDLVKQVYNWILTTYGGTGAKKDYDVADTPVDPDPPAETYDLVASIWNNNGNEMVTEEQLNALKTAFAAYLTEKGITTEVKINWVRETATKVADMGASVNAAGNVDFILACGGNVTSKGNVQNVEMVQIAASDYMAVDRYIAVLNKDNPNQYAKMLYEFMSGQDFPTETPVDPDPTPDPVTPIKITDTKLTVSVWNNSKGAWITQDQLEKLRTDFENYLKERSVNVNDLQIKFRKETATKVADLGESVNTAGDVDFILACGPNVETDGKVTNIEKLQINDTPYMTAGRFIAVLNKDNPRQLATILYKFMSGQDFPITLTDTTLTVSVWNSKGTSVVADEQLAKLEQDFKAYLTELGVTEVKNVNIVWIREEGTKVADFVSAITAAAETEQKRDLAMGGGKNTGTLTDIEKAANTKTDYMANDRYVVVLNKSNPNQLAKLLYEFMTGKTFPSLAEGGAQ